MSLTVPRHADYYILDYNMVSGVPKAAYTPLKGDLVQRETAQANEWDVCAATENPAGIVEIVGPSAGSGAIQGVVTITVAELLPGTTLVLPTTGAIALGNKVRASAGGRVAVGTSGLTRTEVEADVGGVGAVVELTPAGANTATVRF
jgi:hypothetical protein